MGWVDKYKGEGPWDFIPQQDKPHYNEGNLISDHDNPIWDLVHLDNNIPITPTHFPWCGYWTKDYTPSNGAGADIFNLFSSNNLNGDPARIWGVHFDGNRLTDIGTYTPSNGAHGLVLHNEELVTVGGINASAELLNVGTTSIENVFPLLGSYPITNQYDVTTAGLKLTLGEAGKIFYADKAYRLMKFDGFVRDMRGFHNTVTTGTDDNLYVHAAAYASWQEDYRPITNPNWVYKWKLIQDNICDSPITPWGIGYLYRGDNLIIKLTYHQGKIYLINHGSPYSYIRKFNPSTLTIEANASCSGACGVTGYRGKVYTTRGFGYTTWVSAYSASDLAFVDEVSFIGRYGTLLAVGGFIIAVNIRYASTCGIYKIDPDTLEIVDYLITTQEHTTLVAIGDEYVAAGFSLGVSVFRISPNLKLVDDIFTDITYGYGRGSIDTVVK